MEPSRTSSGRGAGPRIVLGIAGLVTLLGLLPVASSAANDGSTAADPLALRVVSFNVLVDFSRPEGIPAWPDRRDQCIELLRNAKADLIGLQEPSPKQYEFFRTALSEYGDVRYQEGTKSYTDVILFYKKDRFEELEHGWWWLSPTPEKSSTGFGNFLPRIVVWAKLREKTSGQMLYVFDTHFDNTQPSQQKMAELCEQRMKPFIEANVPMIFMGDFNTDQNRGDYPRLTSNGWQDSYKASPTASADGRDDNIATCDNGKRIDHIFFHGEQVRATEWQRIEWSDPKQPLSDHWAIQATLVISAMDR